MTKASSRDRSPGTAHSPSKSTVQVNGFESCAPAPQSNGTRRRDSLSPGALQAEESGGTPLFAGLSELVSAPFSICHDREIFGEGEEASFVYKLVKGTVRIGKSLRNGQRHISCFHLPGDVFGLENAVRHRVSAEAIEDSVVLIFRRSHVERLIAREPSAAHQMLDIIAKKLDDAEVHIFRLGRQSAVQSLAAFLLEMESRLGQRRGSLELPMTRRDIADYLGLSMETVSRSISQLRGRHALDRIESRRMFLNQNKIDAMIEH
jgi:CRP/FNR family transcriptional regulator, nitrogen fixation regulation protein